MEQKVDFSKLDDNMEICVDNLRIFREHPEGKVSKNIPLKERKGMSFGQSSTKLALYNKKMEQALVFEDETAQATVIDAKITSFGIVGTRITGEDTSITLAELNSSNIRDISDDKMVNEEKRFPAIVSYLKAREEYDSKLAVLKRGSKEREQFQEEGDKKLREIIMSKTEMLNFADFVRIKSQKMYERSLANIRTIEHIGKKKEEPTKLSTVDLVKIKKQEEKTAKREQAFDDLFNQK